MDQNKICLEIVRRDYCPPETIEEMTRDIEELTWCNLRRLGPAELEIALDNLASLASSLGSKLNQARNRLTLLAIIRDQVQSVGS